MTIVLIVQPGLNRVIDVIADDQINDQLMQDVKAGKVEIVLLNPEVLQKIDAEQRRIGFLADADAMELLMHNRDDPPTIEPTLRVWNPNAPVT